ncbi:MAG: putative hydrolase of the superfamily [Ilumatobacteraceae bacterium]|jgi:putative hydrolase of the HAD superfamily
MTKFEVIGFDADDTLWHSEDGFRANEERFVELITPYAPEGIDIKAALTATERKNLGAFGYGVKSFGLSMVEAAVTISGGDVPSTVVAEMVEMARAQLEEPVRLLDRVPEVLTAVGATHRMILITKGDLIHQTHKVTTSGLAHHFEQVEIVLEKDPETYAGILARHGIDPTRFCMVGNSVRSDILPVLALGGHGVHVPYPILWDLEHVEHDAHFVELDSLAELPAWLDGR